jgi:hypothetical protein
VASLNTGPDKQAANHAYHNVISSHGRGTIGFYRRYIQGQVDLGLSEVPRGLFDDRSDLKPRLITHLLAEDILAVLDSIIQELGGMRLRVENRTRLSSIEVLTPRLDGDTGKNVSFGFQVEVRDTVTYSIGNDVDDDYHDFANLKLPTANHNGEVRGLDSPVFSHEESARNPPLRGFIGRHLTRDLMSGKVFTQNQTPHKTISEEGTIDHSRGKGNVSNEKWRS